MNFTTNSKLLYLPLRELQIYLTNLEIENEKLKSELNTFSRFNCILENIRRSSNKGFNSMQLIDKNKGCRCNDHMNGHLRRMAQEADIELRVWQEQYDKLLLKTKQDLMVSCDDDNRSMSLSPRSSTAVTPPLPEYRNFDSSEAELTVGSPNTSDTNFSTPTRFVCNRKGSTSLDTIASESNETNFSFKQNGQKEDPVIRYINASPMTDESMTSRSPPIVVYDSKQDKRLVCDWPNCDRIFSDEEILIHHRRNHIRKSIYHCEFCSTRLLSKEELENHLKTHNNLKTEDLDRELEPLVVVEEDDDMRVDVETTEVIDLSRDLNKSLKKTKNDTNSEKGINYSSMLYKRLSSNPNPKSVTNSNANSLANKPKVIPNPRAEEYKRTRYSGIGRYRCPWPDCGYTPHFLRDLRRHMYKHTGDKKHKCDYPGCDFVSVWKTSLLQHQRKKHFMSNTHNRNDSLFNHI